MYYGIVIKGDSHFVGRFLFFPTFFVKRAMHQRRRDRSAAPKFALIIGSANDRLYSLVLYSPEKDRLCGPFRLLFYTMRHPLWYLFFKLCLFFLPQPSG